MNVNIRDLLNNIEDSSVELEEKDVVSSDRIKELTKMKLNNDTTKVVRSSKKKIITVSIVAAVIGAIGLSTYAAFGGLDNTTFGKSSWIPDDVVIPTETTAVVTTVESSKTGSAKETAETKAAESSEAIDLSKIPPREDISLQGFSDSPEYKATQEWLQFEKSYDRDYKILDAYDKECKKTGKDKFEKYDAYGVYSQEMADKVDEIAKKYDLKLHEYPSDFANSDEKDLCEKFGNFMSGIKCGAYYYEDGTIGFDGEVAADGRPFQFHRVPKGVFDTEYVNIGAKSGYDQWTYKTKEGYTAYCAIGNVEAYANKGVILIDLGDSFVSILVHNVRYSDLVKMTNTPKDFENIIDLFTFKNLK